MAPSLARIIVPLILMLSLPARAILLDCEKNPDGTYLCVEIGTPSEAAPASPAQTEAAKIEPVYTEQAKKECTYKEPRRRGTGIGAGGALRSEAEKLAREKYEQCLAGKARELKEAGQHQ